MKNMIIAFIATLCSVLIILIGFSIHGRSVRQVELDNALKSSMEDAMTSLLYEEGVPMTEDEWKAAFIQSLAVQINSASELTVIFLECDMTKGILSVEAMLSWYHPVGTKGSVSSIRTVFLETYEE